MLMLFHVFTGLSYCRHLKTVRTHLSGLVNSTLVSVDQPHDASSGLTVEKWQELCQDGVVRTKLSVRKSLKSIFRVLEVFFKFQH